jgi:hypothetical protein
MVGLATYPRDRLGHLRTTAAPASWTSNLLPPQVGPFTLALNADGLAEDARLRVELVDERFQPDPGRAGKSAAIVSKSGLRTPVTFNSGSPAARPQPWRVRLRFEGDKAAQIRFYALYITPTNATA